MQTIILENTVAPRSRLEQVKDMEKQLKMHSEDILSYDNYQQLLKSASKNYDQNTQSNLPRATRKVCHQDVASSLTKNYNSLE